MDIGTVLGLIIAFACCVAGLVLGGGALGSMYDLPSVVIVFGGTAGAVLCCYPMGSVLTIHGAILKSVFGAPADPTKLIKDMVRYAEVARREGILSLENLVNEMKDPFLIRGIKMAVDGTDPDLIKTVLETDVDGMIDRHALNKAILDKAGTMAPAYGMIGTLMGLVVMLQNMSDPSAIGPGMAVALITTLYGAVIANVLTGPIGEKLAQNSSGEVLVKTIIITGVMAIQSGDNPRVVESKLLMFLPPAKRKAIEAASAA